MDLRRRLQLRTLLSAALIFGALLGCLAWWTLNDTRREIHSTLSLVRATVAAVLRAADGASTPRGTASDQTLRHVTLELTAPGQLDEEIRNRPWLDRLIDARTEEINLPGTAAGEAPRVLLLKPNVRSELIEHLWFAATAFGALVLLGLIIAVTQYRTLIRAFAPVQSLKAQLETFERGDLSARLPVPELDELAVIANSFNRLADSLQLTMDEQRRLSQSLISSRTEERHRLARELHDDLGQLLTAISVNVASLKLNFNNPERSRETVLSLERDLQALRQASRKMLADLRDEPDRNMLKQLEPMHVIDTWKERFASVLWLFPEDLSERFGRLKVVEYEVAARILQESLTNVFKHADPTVISIDLLFTPGSPTASADRLVIENDGIAAAEPGEVAASSVSTVSGQSTQLGITGMLERARQIGATFWSLETTAEIAPGNDSATPTKNRKWRVELRFRQA